MKKVTLITGSARTGSNTNVLAERFEKKASESGLEVTRIDAAELEIKPCRGCNGCAKDKSGCIFDDDFNRYFDELVNTDAIVITCPVYWYTMPACIKSLLDKFYAIYMAGIDFKGKKWALMSCCEAEEPETFDGLTFALEKSFDLMGAEKFDMILLPSVNEAGDVFKTEGPELAEKMAERLAESI